MEAYWKEWSNLEAKEVWRWSTLCEWDDVSATARANEEEIHFGYLFGFMVIKGDEFPVGDPRRRWKYRIVFQGNNVRDQDWEVALFQEMSAAPACMEASRCAEAYACFPGHSVQGRDVEQAYITAKLGGPPVYVQLPKELWTAEMWKMKCPVVRLEKALYGHKNSGVYWSEHCDSLVRSAGFNNEGLFNWPSVYWHPTKRLMLVIYVDDMLLSGPAEHMDKAWSELGELINLAKPPGDDDSTHTFLGCTHRRYTKIINGKSAQCSETDVTHAMQKALAKYEVAVFEATGQHPRLFKVNSPSPEDSTAESPFRKPFNDEDYVECPSCLNTMPKSDVENLYTFPAGTKRKLKDIRQIIPKPTVDPEVSDTLGNEWWSGMMTPQVKHLLSLAARGVNPDHDDESGLRAATNKTSNKL